jgi:hypothetical protein
MLESIVATILSKYVGDYVLGLENLKVSLLSGNAVFENLELKKEALDGLDLPITVKGGMLKIHFLILIVQRFPRETYPKHSLETIKK